MENYADDNNEQFSKNGAEPKRHGGELKGKPVQGPDGKWYDTYGKEVSAQEAIDVAYAADFWNRSPQGMRETLAEIIQRNAESAGTITAFIDKDGINENDKQKLSAIRQLARELGYEVGQWQRNPRTHIAKAAVRKV